MLAVTTATQALTTLGALALAAVAPKAAQDLGVSAALIGYQVGAIFFSAMLSALVGGALVRRLGAMRTSQLALALAAAGCALSALGTLATLAAGALVMGLGYGMTNPAASHLLSRALGLGWRAALAACALALGVFAIASEGARRRWDDDREPGAPLLAGPAASLALVWANPVLRWLAGASFLYSAVQLCLTGFLVTYLVAEVGLELVLAGSILALTHAAGAFGRLAWGWLADRLRSGTRALIALGAMSVLGALVTAAIHEGWPTPLVAAAAALFGFSAMGWNGVFMAIIARQSPGRISMATGGSLAVTYAGVVAGPAAFGALHDRAGLSYGGGFALLALLALAGLACVAISRSRSLRAAAVRG